MNTLEKLNWLINRQVRKEKLLIFIVIAQAITVFMLYVFLPGRVPSTQIAFQPDSSVSFCLAIDTFASRFGGEKNLRQDLAKVAEHFKIEGGAHCGDYVITPYRERLTLPFFIYLFSLIGSWKFTLLPSILTFFFIGPLYYILVTARSKKLSLMKFILLLVPFLSPHIAWFAATIMTEGPAILFMLILFRLLIRNTGKTSILFLLSSGIAFILASTSKQVLPLCLLLVFCVLAREKPTQKAARRLSLLFSFALLGLMYSEILTRFARTGDMKVEPKWAASSLLHEPMLAFHGVLLGWRENFGNVLHFYDLPFLFQTVAILLFLRRISLIGSVFLAGAFVWGTATMGIVFIACGLYGDNFRFLVFLTFLFWPIAENFKKSDYQFHPRLEPR